jgi:uncharacterized protein YjbI with pentapeptide repeats
MIEIKHRLTGAVLHTVEAKSLIGADLSNATLSYADLSGANLGGANLGSANLDRAAMSGANLGGAKLNGALMRGAYLYRANLHGADLYGANLYGANLYGVDLHGADLSGVGLHGIDLSKTYLYGAVINADKLKRLLARATRIHDGFEFFLFSLCDGPPKVKAGCRWLTIADYRAHVANEYPDTLRARETLAILDYFEALT